jgi:hypothetical protein
MCVQLVIFDIALTLIIVKFHDVKTHIKLLLTFIALNSTSSQSYIFMIYINFWLKGTLILISIIET